MKNIIKRVLSIVLTLAMLLSCIPAYASDSSDTELTFNIKFTSDAEGENNLNRVEAGENFRMWVTFYHNPTEKEDSIQAYDLLICYDTEKISLPNGNDSVVECLTAPTFNHAFADGVAYAGWASTEGIVKDSAIQSDGKLFAIDAKAKTTLTAGSLGQIKIINEATNGDIRQVSQLTDGNGNKIPFRQEITLAGSGGGNGGAGVPDRPEDIPATVPAKSLKFVSTKLTVYENCEYDLSEKLTVTPDDYNDIIEWTSSKEDVVTVDENGVLTAVSMGSAKITVKAVAGGKSATCTVTVARLPEWIELSGDNAVAQSKTITLKADAYYRDEVKNKDVKTKDTISWRSDDEDIATVSGGKVKGISAGRTRIYAYIDGTDLEESIEVSVVVPVKTLKLATTKLTIYENNDYDLGEKLTLSPDDHNDIIEWTSSKEDVVTVDENGVLTAVSMGSAKITVKAVAGGKSATCTVTVARLPEWIELSGDNAVAQGKTITLKADAYYRDEVKNKDVKTKDTISWRSDDEDIATVSGGKVKGISAGTTTIYAYIDGTDLEEAIEVSVVVPVKTLKLATTKLTIYENNDYDLGEKLTLSPDDHNDIIEWTSSKEDVVTVDENGVLTAISMGSAKITVKAVAGGKSATCTVTVARLPEWIELSGDNAVAQGKTITLKADAYYRDEVKNKDVKTKDTISWRSDDETIATVSGGKVKGISAGRTRIYAYIDGTDLEEWIPVEVIVPAKSLEFEMSKLDAFVGDEIDLSDYLTVSPEDCNDEIEWTSSKESVATVSRRGVVEIVGEGTAKITAKAVIGGKSAYITITAEEKDITSEELRFHTTSSFGNVTIEGENLEIVQDGDIIEVTISGIDVEDSYITNKSSSDIDVAEYNWEVVMHDFLRAYSVSTSSWAFDPGANEEISVRDMQHSLWDIYDNRGAGEWITNVSMKYSDDSITWRFNSTDGCLLDFEHLERIEVRVNGALNDEYIERIYTSGPLPGGGSTSGPAGSTPGGSDRPDDDEDFEDNNTPSGREYQDYRMDVGGNCIYRDDEVVEGNYPIVLYRGNVFCPIRLLGEAFECNVSYDHATRTVTFEKGEKTISYEQDDEFYAVIDGVSYIYVEDFLLNMFGDEFIITADEDGLTATKNEEADTNDVKIILVQNGNEIIAKWTGTGASRYYFEFVDSDGNYVSSGGTNGNECQSFDLALWLPRTNEDCTYSFVLYAEDENYNMTEIARLDNCLEITVSGDALRYDIVFNDGESGKHSVTLTDEALPQGVKLINDWYDEQGWKRSSGTSSIGRNKTEHIAIQNGYSYDLRVLKEYDLDGQTIKATITHESKKTYINENEAKIKWNVDGIITWQALENVENYKLNIYSGEGVDADNFITYRNLGKYHTEYFVDANLNIAELAGNEDGILTVELVAYDADYQLIEVVGTLTIDVSFAGEAPVFDIEVLDERNYVITFQEGTPDGMRYMQWYDADGNLSGGKAGFGDTSLSETEMKDYEFADGDKLEVYITTFNTSTDTVWTIERTPIATWTYTAE